MTFRRFLVYAFVFFAGSVATFLPFFVRAHLMNAAELARREQTMGPGIITFAGLLAAPLGGVFMVVLALLTLKVRARKAK